MGGTVLRNIQHVYSYIYNVLLLEKCMSSYEYAYWWNGSTNCIVHTYAYTYIYRSCIVHTYRSVNETIVFLKIYTTLCKLYKVKSNKFKQNRPVNSTTKK